MMIGRDRCFCLVRAIISGELNRLLPEAARREAPALWNELTRIDEDGLGFDSLARIDLIGVFNARFSLHLTGIEDYLMVHATLGEWAELLEEHFKRIDENTPITFFSSGTTGIPKSVSHSLGYLLSEVEAHFGSSFAAVPERVLTLVPPHHIYGFLFSVLLPSSLQRPVVDLCLLGPGALGRALASGDLVVGTPFHLERALPLSGAKGIGATALTSTAPAPPTLWDQARSAGFDKLVEIYGSSETGGVGYRDAPECPFRLLPDLSSGNPPCRRGMPLQLQDRLDWVSHDLFHVGGRKDGAIQVGGHNVFPAELARLLERYPGVAEACVRAGGDRLKAFIVPCSGANPAELEVELRNMMAQCQIPAARPASYAFGPTLPRTSMGKLADWSVEADIVLPGRN